MTAHEGIVTSIIVLNVLILIGAMVIIIWSIWSEMNDINKKLNSAIHDKVDINISKKLSNNVKFAKNRTLVKCLKGYMTLGSLFLCQK